MWSVSTSTLLRSAIVGIAIAFGSMGEDVLTVLPWALLILTLDLVAGSVLKVGFGQPNARRSQALILTMFGAGIAGAGIASSQTGPMPAALLLLMIPSFRAGEVWGRLAAAAAVSMSVIVAFATAQGRGNLTAEYSSSTLQWGVLAISLGLLGAWTAQLQIKVQSQAEVASPAAHEAARLLRRLDALAGALDGGFDAPASAELLLDAVKAKIPGCRMAVLVGFGSEPAVPLALRGIDRLPWPDPTTADFVLGRVWRTGVAETGFWEAADHDRAIAAAAMRDPDGERIGVVVVDRVANLAFSVADLAALVALAESHSANVDVAMIFTALRQRAAFEERERLAREMHDGIAQELVALGYRIDVTRRHAAAEAPHLAEALDDARADLSRVLTDLRLRIADLRLAVRPDQGLGAVVGARLQQFGAASGLTVGLRLNESTYRLPAHVETLIYRLVLDVLADARHAQGTTTVELRLDVNAPQAWMHISHDGVSALSASAFVDHPLTAVGAEILVQPGDTGVVVTLALNARRPRHSPYLVPERMRLIS